MASPKRPEPAYGYSMPLQASPSYPQYPQPSAPFNPQPFDINALFKILGIAPSSTSGSSGVGTGGIGGPIGATPLPLPGKANEPVGTYNPGFLGMPMPISPQAPLPDMSTILPALPPQMPGGPIAPPMAPPYNPALMTTADDMRGRPSTGGTNVDQLLAALRAMQGRTTAPQAPFVPDYMLPINQNTAAIDPNMPISDEQRYKMLENFMGREPSLVEPVRLSPTESAMNRALRIAREAEKARIMGEMPRMPQGREGTPRIGPSPVMRGSGMGLEGILQGIEASRRSSR